MSRKPNRSKNIVAVDIGLLKDSVWKYELHGYPTSLICLIRKRLLKRIPGITEKFNRNSRYFGYWTGGEKDRAYIYVRMKDLRIDLCIGRDSERAIRGEGFEVSYVNNWQGRADWLTGWHVPHSRKNVNRVVARVCEAFKGKL